MKTTYSLYEENLTLFDREIAYACEFI